MQEAGSLGLLIPNPGDLSLFKAKLLSERGILALPVQQRLPVVTRDHCRRGSSVRKGARSRQLGGPQGAGGVGFAQGPLGVHIPSLPYQHLLERRPGPSSALPARLLLLWDGLVRKALQKCHGVEGPGAQLAFQLAFQGRGLLLQGFLGRQLGLQAAILLLQLQPHPCHLSYFFLVLVAQLLPGKEG